MIIKFTKLLTIKVLRKIAKINGIKYISTLNKDILLDYLNYSNRVKCIQRHFREKNMTEDHCPISMEKLKYPFIVIKSHNKFNYYDFNTIAKYFLSTRDFRDPLTRELVPDKLVKDINRLIRYYYGQKSNKHLWTDSMIKEMELRCIANNLESLLNYVLSSEELTLDFIYRIVNPRFILYFQLLTDKYNRNIICKAISIATVGICEHKCKEKQLILKSFLEFVKINNLDWDKTGMACWASQIDYQGYVDSKWGNW